MGPVDTAVCQGASLLKCRDVQCLECCFTGTGGPGVTTNKCLRSQDDLLNGPFKSLSMHLEQGNHLVYSANVLLAKSILPAEQASLSNKKHPVCFAGGKGNRDVRVSPRCSPGRGDGSASGARVFMLRSAGQVIAGVMLRRGEQGDVGAAVRVAGRLRLGRALLPSWGRSAGAPSPPASLSKGFVPAKAAQESFCFSPLSGLFFSS